MAHTIESEEAIFKNWLEEAKSEGLVDFKLYPSNTDSASKESFYAELNEMNHAYASSRFELIRDL